LTVELPPELEPLVPPVGADEVVLLVVVDVVIDEPEPLGAVAGTVCVISPVDGSMMIAGA
jgi:hypothetical protein